jgi:hypothetical protein
MLGFTNIVDPSTQLRVWIKHNKDASNKIPLVFIHGIGLGIVPYIGKICQLSIDRRIILVPEIPNISYDLYKFPPPSNDKITKSLYNILIKQDIELIDIIAHSYGTTILNIFQIKYPHMCNYKTYAETGCLYIQQTHLINTLIFIKKSYSGIIDYMKTIILYKDIYTQFILNRCVFYENTLIKNFDDKTTIILADNDDLVPSYHIHKYITTHFPQVCVEMIEGNHGAYIFG